MAELELFSWDRNEEEAGKCLDLGWATPRNGQGTALGVPEEKLVAREDSPLSVVVDVGCASCLFKEDTLP